MEFIKNHIAKKKKIHGVEIGKLPLGRYLDAVNHISDMPFEVVKEVFPNKTFMGAYNEFVNADNERFLQIVLKLIVAVPNKILEFLSVLVDVSYEELRDKYTPLQIAEIIRALWDANEISNFITLVKGLVKKKM